jgi:membrane protease YdiL (CAAX protease family)
LKKKVLISITVILTFIFARYLKYFYAYVVFGKEHWNALDNTFATNLLVYSQILLVFIVSSLLFRRKAFEILGLDKGLLKGAVIGFICSLPMFLGYAFLNGFEFKLDLSLIHRDFILAGFFEELLFRGFLFGILFYVVGWGFIPAVILPSIYFGLGHLYQAENMSETINVFLFTGIGSAGFAWFYTAFKNLWIVIFLHAFMDLAWDMFQIESNVTGGLLENIFRFITLGLMIFLAIRNTIQNTENKITGKLWINKG